MKEAADTFLKDVFKAMELPVTITLEYNEETGNLDINFSGDDMGMLIENADRPWILFSI